MVDVNYDRKHAKDLSQDLDEVIRQFVADCPDVTIQSLCAGVGWTLMSLPQTMHEAPIVPVPPSQPGVTVVSGEGKDIGAAIADLKNKVEERTKADTQQNAEWQERDGVVVHYVNDATEPMSCNFYALTRENAEAFVARYLGTVPTGRSVRFDATIGKGASEKFWSLIRFGEQQVR